MTAETIKTIQRLLTDLSADELISLKAQITALQSLAPAHGVKPAAFETDTLALECIQIVMQRLGVEFCTPPVLRRMATYTTFRQKIGAVEIFLQQAPLSRSERQVLLMIGIECLYRNLCKLGLPVTAGVLMKHFHRLPAMINVAFPGYAEAGLLHMIPHNIGDKKHARHQHRSQSIRR